MALIISGALVMGYLIAATFFFRFWRQTADRLFLMFSAAFLILAAQRLALALTGDIEGHSTALYSMRLLAFLIIIVAIVDKNRSTAR